MKKSIIPFSIMLAAILTLQSCSRSPASPQNIQNSPNLQLFPMAVGNSWTYTKSNYDASGNVTASMNATLTIPRDTTISGETWYFYAYHGTIYWTTRADGVWRWPFTPGEITTPSLYLKYPTVAGDTISDSNTVFTRTITTTLSLDSLTTTPLGNFHCVLYRQSDFRNDTLYSEEYMYYSPGIGWIATDEYRQDSLGRHKAFRQELISYSLK